MRVPLDRRPQEYLASEDAAEAERALRALAVPFFHHEFVRQVCLLPSQLLPAALAGCTFWALND